MKIENAYKKLGLLLDMQLRLYNEYEENRVTESEQSFTTWSNSMMLLIREVEKERQLIDIMKLDAEN